MTTDNAASQVNDWRIRLFGDNIICNALVQEESPKTTTDDPEAPSRETRLVSTPEAFDTSKYDYIGVFIGADYCPHCKAFAPTVNTSAALLAQDKRCKVIFVTMTVRRKPLRPRVARMPLWTLCLTT